MQRNVVVDRRNFVGESDYPIRSKKVDVDRGSLVYRRWIIVLFVGILLVASQLGSPVSGVLMFVAILGVSLCLTAKVVTFSGRQR